MVASQDPERDSSCNATALHAIYGLQCRHCICNDPAAMVLQLPCRSCYAAALQLKRYCIAGLWSLKKSVSGSRVPVNGRKVRRA